MQTTWDGSSGNADVAEISWSDTVNTLPDHQGRLEDSWSTNARGPAALNTLFTSFCLCHSHVTINIYNSVVTHESVRFEIGVKTGRYRQVVKAGKQMSDVAQRAICWLCLTCLNAWSIGVRMITTTNLIRCLSLWVVCRYTADLFR